MKNNNGDLPASPCGARQDGYNPGWTPEAIGKTKREDAAFMAMQGMLSNPQWTYEGFEGLAKLSLQAADALLAELDKDVQ